MIIPLENLLIPLLSVSGEGLCTQHTWPRKEVISPVPLRDEQGREKRLYLQIEIDRKKKRNKQTERKIKKNRGSPRDKKYLSVFKFTGT